MSARRGAGRFQLKLLEPGRPSDCKFVSYGLIWRAGRRRMGAGGGSVMAKPLIAAFVLAATAGLLASSARAADLGVSGPSVQAAECGPCGCVRVTYDYHRELESTYGLGFDPRNYDTT